MKLEPRHIKALKVVALVGVCCTPYIREQSGIVRIDPVIKSLNNANLIAYGRRQHGLVSLKGWVLTERGEAKAKKLFPDVTIRMLKEIA